MLMEETFSSKTIPRVDFSLRWSFPCEGLGTRVPPVDTLDPHFKTIETFPMTTGVSANSKWN
jgi:hypothetical protein